MSATVLLVALLSACVVGGSRCGDRGAGSSGLVIFEATVGSVADDGATELRVESVEPLDRSMTTAPIVFGVPNDTIAPALESVVAGTTVVVAFPADVVEHLRRDVGRRYHVEAAADGPGGSLTSVLDDMRHPCGPTHAVD